MMHIRLQVLPTGEQKILPIKTGNNINAEFIDLRHDDDQYIERWLATPRTQIQTLLPSLNQGQPYFVKVARMSGYCRLFLGLHMIDGPSVRLIFRDFLYYLTHSSRLSLDQILPLSLSFRDYVLARQSLAQQRLAIDKKYWLTRLEQLPAAPQLPLAKISSEKKQQNFIVYRVLFHQYNGKKYNMVLNNVRFQSMLCCASYLLMFFVNGPKNQHLV